MECDMQKCKMEMLPLCVLTTVENGQCVRWKW